MDKNTLIQLVREAGVVGEGGAGFPAHVKYDTQVDTVIANGCECEPLLYTDQYIMNRHAAEIVRALKTVMAAMGARRGVIAIKSKYTDIEARFKDAIAGSDLELALMGNFYPAGDEFVLVHEITGQSIPPLGLPKDVGVVVSNVGTLLSVSNAMDGLPVTHKVLTVTGEVARPGILRVPIGTGIADCVDQCGGASVVDPIYLMGGPMMGKVVDTAEAISEKVITKTDGGIVVLPRGHYLHESAALSLNAMQKRAATACIQCRYCTDQCPRYLIGHQFETHKVMRAFSGGIDVAMEAMQASMCCECGVCELFSCPMRLSPRRINALLKAEFAAKGVKYQGPREVREEQSALRSFRKVPVSRLAYKLDISGYMSIHPEFLGDYTPAQVRIPLQQHIGAAAVAQVSVGDTVTPGDKIGTIPESALGAAVHASISGVVTEVGRSIVVKGA